MQFDLFAHHFWTNTKTVEYQDKGIFFSEAFIIAYIHNYLGCKWMIESGVLNGMSTELWIRSMPETHIFSVDRNIRMEVGNRLARIASEFAEFKTFWKFVAGDSYDMGRYILDHKKTKEGCGTLFIDGPKGLGAINLAHVLNREKIDVIAIHDYNKHYFDKPDFDAFSDYELVWASDYFGAGRSLYLANLFDINIPLEWRSKYPIGPGIAIWVRKSPALPILIEVLDQLVLQSSLPGHPSFDA